MSVETTATISGPLAANGVTTVFPFTFRVMAGTDVAVAAYDADGVAATLPDFEVSIASETTGSVTFETAPDDGLSVYVYSSPSFLQETEFENGSRWLAGPVNDVNDRAAVRDLYLRAQLGRALVAPIGQTAPSLADFESAFDGASEDREAAAASAVESQNSALASAAHALEALGSANAAAAFANPFDSTALGIAGTVDGEFFSVSSGEGTTLIYRNDAETATLLVTLGNVQADPNGRAMFSPALTRRYNSGPRITLDLAALRAGTATRYPILQYGDSLGFLGGAYFQVVAAGHMPTSPVYTSGGAVDLLGYGAASTKSAISLGVVSGTGTDVVKTDYVRGFTGSYYQLAAGQTAIYGLGGTVGIGDYVLVDLIHEPGASTAVKIEYSTNESATAGPWLDPLLGEIDSGQTLTGGELIVDTSAVALGLTVVKLKFAEIGNLSIKITNSGAATARVSLVSLEVHTASSVSYHTVAQPSNDFANTNSLSIPLEAQRIAAVNPGVIWITSDEGDTSYEHFLPMLWQAIQDSGLAWLPAVVLEVGPGYHNGGFTDQVYIDKLAYLYRFAAGKLNWYVLDAFSYVGGYDEWQRTAYSGDGIHWDVRFSKTWVEPWANEHGWLANVQRQAGGDAGARDILAGDTDQPLTARSAASVALLPIVSTALTTWASTKPGSETLTQNNAKDVKLTTVIGANSVIAGYPDLASGSLLGSFDTRPYGNEVRGFSARVRSGGDWTATTLFYLLLAARTYNAAYAGVLAAEGVGFRSVYDSGAYYLEGIAWRSGALVVSTGRTLVPDVPNQHAVDVAIVLEADAVGAGIGSGEWLAGSRSLGTFSYDHISIWNPRAELTNGSGGGVVTVNFSPPVIALTPTSWDA